ncbi:Uncharacterised protein [Brevibacterium casei]|uniref:Uncharacterized protein n=1 Tax=Brevibacterium casei TaxID=33889 RepID=A0A449CZM9_9MICO|nr:Uncharacterised protein [Brevibacterium casei]
MGSLDAIRILVEGTRNIVDNLQWISSGQK